MYTTMSIQETQKNHPKEKSSKIKENELNLMMKTRKSRARVRKNK